jgi:ribosomal protein S18 acetylase RimI-like enzyme
MIRPYKPADKEYLLKIFRANTPKYFDENEIKEFEAYQTQKAETYLTIEQDHTIVGGTGYYINGDDNSGRITWIFFDPNYAGRGLGKESVEHCLNILGKDKNVKKFIVTTSQFAYKFFEKFGYHNTRIENNYWGKDLDLYEMEKPIT